MSPAGTGRANTKGVPRPSAAEPPSRVLQPFAESHSFSLMASETSAWTDRMMITPITAISP
jgi:hypothetical protein